MRISDWSSDVCSSDLHETGGNIAVYEAQLDDAMKLYGRLGVGAVKTGYVADAGGIIAPGDAPGATRMEWHDGQRQVQHHLKVVETAAKYHVAVNPHEPVKDTGLRSEEHTSELQAL